MQPCIVLVNPQIPGNIGAVARVMKNFGFDQLHVVNPDCEVRGEGARQRAMHAKDVLGDATVTTDWPELDYLVATTARLGGDYNVKCSPLTPEEAVPKLTADADVGLVFGREDNGLSNEEVMRCDYVVTIPTSHEYPTLNLSHAVAILLYEIQRGRDEGIGTDIDAIGAEEKEILLDIIDDVLDSVDYQTGHDETMDRFLWQRLIGRAMPTSREARALMGFFKKLRSE